MTGYGRFIAALQPAPTKNVLLRVNQYRLFAVFSWVSATSTAAMGDRWQPADVGRGGMERATTAIADLDSVGLLEERLGTRRRGP